MKHTPGEWISEIQKGVRFGAFDAVSKADGSATIAIVYGKDDDERRANATLIAAAPKMLDVLDSTYQLMLVLGVDPTHPNMVAMDEAIKKATT